MEKLSRSLLKSIVKECIVEIFQESFFESNHNISMISESEKSLRTKNGLSRNQGRDKKRIMNSVPKEDGRLVRNESFDRKIDNITSNMTSDPVFADIFKDTANTTLQNQIGAESKTKLSAGFGMQPGADKASFVASQSDPMELFSESANKWASLAFSNQTK